MSSSPIKVSTASEFAPPAAHRKRVASCIPCKERHIRCGKERPACSNCKHARFHRVCSYESKRGLQFRSTLVRPQPNSEANGVDTEAKNSARYSDVKGHFHRESLSLQPEGGIQHSDKARPDFGDDGIDISTNEKRAAQDLLKLKSYHQPLSDSIECDIFSFYAHTLGSWIDIGSPSRYFQARVPQLAMTNSLLFYACLSCSSQILALKGQIDKSLEELYSAKVLETLIPVLSSEAATTSNEALLATTVILRMSEQFLEIDNDSRRHLHGAASLFNSSSHWSLSEVNLATAAFWTHSRESIRVSFLHECPSEIQLQSLIQDQSLPIQGSHSDEVWTNYMTYLLLQVIQLCWGGPADYSEHTRLSMAMDAWETSLPSSFRPWCFSHLKKDHFPRIQCFESWHVIAWQFYYVARVMLAVYSLEHGPRSDLNNIRRRMEDEVVGPTQMLCGLCIASTSNVGNTLNGSHLMAWSGQFLYDPGQKDALEVFLINFSGRTYWPTFRSLEKLRSRWEASGSSCSIVH